MDQYEAARREREATESLMEEDTAKEILGWIFEAAITFPLGLRDHGSASRLLRDS